MVALLQKMKNGSVLVVFGEETPNKKFISEDSYTVIAPGNLKSRPEFSGVNFIPIDSLIGQPSIYEAALLLEQLALLRTADGSRLSKIFIYKGFELWWLNFTNIFIYYCLPYSQYSKLLENLKNYKKIYFFGSFKHKDLFSCFLSAHKCKFMFIEISKARRTIFPFGVLVQILLTFVSLPILIMKKIPVMLYVGDKFEKGKDYDFRMSLIYSELRQKNIIFVEFIRSLESWKNIIQHFFTRKRPVIYSQAISFIARFLSVTSGGRMLARKKLDHLNYALENDPEQKFRILIATQFLKTVYDEIWGIRIMQFILRITGVKTAFITAATERSYQTVLACKLNGISTIGIMHGVQLRNYNVYDFLQGFDGVKKLTVDKFGVWSDWWKEYYIKNSQAYSPEQLYVSGPMRPLQIDSREEPPKISGHKIRVLFLSEEVAVPEEVLPYLNKLLEQPDLEVTLKFRPAKDAFEQWITKNKPEILSLKNLNIAKEYMQEAIKNTDVAVGCQSTGVLEALLQLKVP